MITIAAQEDGCTAVSDRFLSAFMPSAPEGYVKVYLYGLLLAKSGTEACDMAAALKMGADEIVLAYRYWQGQGLVSLSPGDPPIVRYLSAAMAVPVLAEQKYADLNKRLQALFQSRAMYMPDQARLYDFIEVYGLEQSAVVMLVEHCIRENDASGRKRLNFNHLDATARAWADMGVRNAAQAEAFLSSLQRHKEGASSVLRRLGKRRAPAEDELALYEKWTAQLGFSPEAILCACAELTAYGTPSFKALDGVLQNFHRRGITSLPAMEEALRQSEQSAAFAQTVFSRMGVSRAPALSERQQLDVWRGVWHMNDELILFAAERAMGDSKPFARCKALLESFRSRGITRLADAQAFVAQSAQSEPKKPKRGKAYAYLQREPKPDAPLFAIDLDDE